MTKIAARTQRRNVPWDGPRWGGIARVMDAGWKRGLLCLGLAWGVLIGGGEVVVAQATADAYFHRAAQAYVANEAAVARRAVKQGLAVAPSDPRLQALQKKLRQQRASSPREDSSSSSASKKDRGGGDGSEASSEEGGGRSEDVNRMDDNRQRPDSSARDASGNGGSPTQETPPRPPDSARPGRGGRPVDSLSREQAERLLRALEGQERRLLRQLRRQAPGRRTVEKDW